LPLGCGFSPLPSNLLWPYQIVTTEDGKSKRKKVHPRFAWMR
jgi:hypothetical protein